jgi:hypothetical protein
VEILLNVVSFRCLQEDVLGSKSLLSLINRVFDSVNSFCDIYFQGRWMKESGQFVHSEYERTDECYTTFHCVSKLLYHGEYWFYFGFCCFQALNILYSCFINSRVAPATRNAPLMYSKKNVFIFETYKGCKSSHITCHFLRREFDISLDGRRPSLI